MSKRPQLKILTFLFLGILISIELSAQKIKPDSIYQTLSNEKIGLTKRTMNALNLIRYLKDTTVQFKEFLMERAIDLTLSSEDNSEKDALLQQISNYGHRQKLLDFTIVVLEDRLNQSNVTLSPNDYTLLKYTLGTLYKNQPNVVKASENLLDALRGAETAKDTFLICKIAYFLSGNYHSANRVDTALVRKYMNMAYQLSKNIDDPYLGYKPYYTKGLADIYLEYMRQDGITENQKQALGQLALKYYREGADLYDPNDKSHQAWHSESLARLGLAHHYLGEHEKAFGLFEQYYQTTQGTQVPQFMAQSSGYMAKHFAAQTSQANLKKALPFCREALYNSNLVGDFEQITAYEKLTADVFDRLGQYDSAYYHLTQWVTLKDRALEKENIKQLAEMETKFETEKKELTIAAQEQQLEQSQKIQMISFGGLALLGLVAFLLYRTASIRRKTNQLLAENNRQLETKNNEIEHQKLEIEEKNNQNELLLKEIHHRVKNNLQVISSLLNLQSMHIDDEKALDAVKEGQGRVKSMALIHQQLYQGENLASIEMNEYIGALLKSLASSFGVRPDKVEMINEVPQMEMDVDVAIPLGLIINELVTNSMKYAFPNDQTGHIKVALQNSNKGEYLLTVSDNGVGKDNAEKLDSSTAFGTKLIQILVKKLKGSVEQLNGVGMTTRVKF